MDIDKQANGNKRRGIDKATIDDVRKGNNKDKNIGRGENKSKNVRGRMRKYSQTNSIILILFSILINTSILNKAHQEHHY